MQTIIGFKRSAGNYEGNDYDMVIIYTVSPIESNGLGDIGNSDKIKTSFFCDIFNCDTSNLSNTFSGLIGTKIALFYDKWQKVTHIEILEQEVKKL